MSRLELLAPAKNLEQGREAISHGADAIYIGAPAFGARVAAGNSLDDIEKLAHYAHLYHAKVFSTVNTLLFDDEIEDAVKLIHQLYNIGVDACIIQDLGLLECDLPPIELHASTQTHNATVERVKFLEKAGFSRVILARETSLEQMCQIRHESHVDLEAFVQGALCVSYSGQCYMSQYLSNRSGNRGCCGQPCRSSYDLYDADGTLLRKDDHLLSLKDFSAADHLQEMVDAGITSFKIEGRLKDMSYVKNVTAYYRQLLDRLMNGTPHTPASSGHCEFFFTPDLTKTFNRGFTDYFLTHRQPMATMSTQKSIGKKIGKVTHIDRNGITISSVEPLTTGDGICFFTPQGELDGFLVNHVQAETNSRTDKKTLQKDNPSRYIVVPNRMPQNILPGTELWRNNDQAFEKQLQGRSANRKIDVDFILSETADGLQLTLHDTDGCQATASITCPKEIAHNPIRAVEQVTVQLSKLGDTIYSPSHIENRCEKPYFLPAATLNELRRLAVAALDEQRVLTHLLNRGHRLTPTTENNSVEEHLDYRANIINEKSEQFYRHHGAKEIEYGVEKSHDYKGKALMTTKYCLRYELGCCMKSPNRNDIKEPLYLRNNKNWFQLRFDCKNCQMQVLLAEKSPFDGKNQ